MTTPPLIVHLLHSLDLGGMENALIARLNRMPDHAYRHAIVSLTRVNPEMALRLRRTDVETIALRKPPGLGIGMHRELHRVLRRLRPDVLHAYNLAAMEYAPAARVAGVRVCVHGSHGREADDPDGTRPAHLLLRRAMTPFYDCCYANSRAMLAWLREQVRVPEHKSCYLPNGVDLARFVPQHRPAQGRRIVIGMIARMQSVKDPLNLFEAFLLLRERLPHLRERLQLALVGEGPLRTELRARVVQAGLGECVWLPGDRRDVPDLLESFRVFALPSVAEGMPGAVLEAMAAGLPVVAARVGGLPEVVEDGVTGRLVRPCDPRALALALEPYVLDAALAQHHGSAGRARVEQHYSIDAMVDAYRQMYDRLLQRSQEDMPCAE
jgi:sugar transferase (PEP-CTERM/EpsH1 system associated)